MALGRAYRMMVGGMALVAILGVGCENGDDGDDVPANWTNGVADVDAEDVEAVADPNFPDGLHPSAAASGVIAATFARQIAPVTDVGGNDANVVVCLGDSITARGYPSDLAAKTGLTVVNEGKGGERSSGGAARVGTVLAQHRPAYLCVLYGANDVCGGVPAADVLANLAAIVEAARANQTIPIVATLTPMSGERAEYAAAARDLSAAIRAQAGQLGVALADLEAAF